MTFPLPLARLEAAVLEACAGEGEWAAQVTAGIYAGVDFAIAHPEVALAAMPEGGTEGQRHYETVVRRLAGLLQARAPRANRLPPATDEALVAGIVGLVGDHLRIGRRDRLKELRPDLVLLTLLPYVGFQEAQRWANSRKG